MSLGRLALAALFGVLLGMGLGLGANVSGVVLAGYGLLLAVVLAVLATTVGERRRGASPSARTRH